MTYNLSLSDIKELASYFLRCDKSRIVIRKKVLSEKMITRGPIGDTISDQILPYKSNTVYFVTELSLNAQGATGCWLSSNIMRQQGEEREILHVLTTDVAVIKPDLSFCTGFYAEFAPTDTLADFIYYVSGVVFEINLV
ncbi:hypothetical protein [uncultured Bacteroides sp.]|uniref:hypothetical protein n=1 Tax=uncultured Bacteroides sp. TaxID=162156 RepID=UPI002AA83777|nr:hypothetical protein [uncultured Bacteroides sp.]